MKNKPNAIEKHAARKEILTELFDTTKNGGIVIGGLLTGKQDKVRRNIREDLKPVLDIYPENFLRHHKESIKRTIMISLQDDQTIGDVMLQHIKGTVAIMFRNSEEYQPGILPPAIPREISSTDPNIKKVCNLLITESSQQLLAQEESGEDRDAQRAFNKAYKVLSLKMHPDKHPNDPEATNNFQNLSNAKDLLESERVVDYKNESILYTLRTIKAKRQETLKQSAQDISSGISDLVVSDSSSSHLTHTKPTAVKDKKRQR